jgi:signal transduction histidine kinase
MYRRISKYIGILFLYLILFQTSVCAQKSTPDLFPRTTLDFYILESELSEGNYLTGDMYDLGYSIYNNKEIPNNRPVNDRMITLRSEFTIDSIYAGQKLYLVAMPVNSPCNIYFNGELIFVQGNYKNGYTSRMHYTENIFLAPVLIRFNEKNQIAFQLYPKEGENHPLNKPFIANAREAKNYVFYRNFFGPKLILASSFCGFIFFIFFLFTYISRREYNKPQFLYFALMNLFFIFSLINNIFTYDYINTFIIELISRLGFQLSMIVGLFFLIEYTNIFKNKFYLRIGVLTIYIPAIILLSLQHNLAELMRVNNSYPIFMLIFGNIFFVVITLIYFIKEKSIKSFILLFIFLFNLLSGFHDSYYFVVLKFKPYLLLTPNSVFLMNLTIFFILLIDHSKIYHLAINTSKQLRELNENLESLVDKRTKKVVEYTNKLEEVNKTKDKFFSIIAHDLKNPFNTLIGYSDILKSDFREYGQDEIYQQLNIIYDTSVNGYNLLENLLKWSQTQTDKIVFEPVKIKLHEIVQSCIDDIENQSQFKDIDINNDIPENYHIIADENLLKTILRNLINNAIKFTNRNGMVSISLYKDDKVTEISVKDTGIGISESELQNLFKIDKIYSKPGTNKEKGSGLGLILCKEFVEKHGGKIWVESELEIGSVFKFTIPKIIQMN